MKLKASGGVRVGEKEVSQTRKGGVFYLAKRKGKLGKSIGDMRGAMTRGTGEVERKEKNGEEDKSKS